MPTSRPDLKLRSDGHLLSPQAGLGRELAYLVARGRIDREQAAAFTADLERRDARGSFLAVVVTYAATATAS